MHVCVQHDAFIDQTRFNDAVCHGLKNRVNRFFLTEELPKFNSPNNIRMQIDILVHANRHFQLASHKNDCTSDLMDQNLNVY